MTEAIIVALITGGCAVAGTVITVLSVNRKSAADIAAQIAVIKTQITDLTREVREHNNFARRMPVVEEQIKVANHRISDIEEELKKKK